MLAPNSSRLKFFLSVYFIPQLICSREQQIVGENTGDFFGGLLAVERAGCTFLFIFLLFQVINRAHAFAENFLAKVKVRLKGFRIFSFIRRIPLTLYTLTLVCVFSIIFSIYFPNLLTRRICFKIKNFFIW